MVAPVRADVFVPLAAVLVSTRPKAIVAGELKVRAPTTVIVVVPAEPLSDGVVPLSPVTVLAAAVKV